MSVEWSLHKSLNITRMAMKFFIMCVNMMITYGNVNVQH